MSRYVQIDSSEVLAGLSGLLNPKRATNRDVQAALVLLNHLLLADRVTFDGKTGEGRAKKIDQLRNEVLNKVTESNWLESRFMPLIDSPKNEKKVLQSCAKKATQYLELVNPRLESSRKILALYGEAGLTDPSKYLYEYLRPENRLNACDDRLLKMDEITGRRFYWALRSNHSTLVKLARLKERRILGPKRLSLLFTKFRSYLTESLGEDYATRQSAISFYHPCHERSAFFEDHDLRIRAKRDAVAENLIPTIEKLYIDEVAEGYYASGRVVVPFVLHHLLKTNKIKTGIDLVNCVIQEQDSDYFNEVREAIRVFEDSDKITQSHILNVLPALLQCRLSGKDLRAIEGKQVIIKVVLAVAKADAAEAFRLSIEHFRKWLGKTRKAAIVLSNLPVQMMSNEDSLARVYSLFGKYPVEETLDE